MRTAILAGTVLVLLLGASWAGLPYLKPLGELIPMTRSMVSTTGEILRETKALQAGVTEVRSSLHQLARQEQLLIEQEALTRDLLAQLGEQERMAARSGRLLREILQTESTTVALAGQVDRVSAATLQGLRANGTELDKLIHAAGQVEAGSRNMDGQLGNLIAVMDESVENFKVVARLKEAADKVKDRTGNWFTRLWEWFKW